MEKGKKDNNEIKKIKKIKRAATRIAVAVMGGAIISTPFFTSGGNVFAATNGKTAAQAISWVKSKVGKGIDMDGAYGNQCVDLAKAYYSYLGQSPVRGNGCDYATNAKPSGWTRLKGAKPKKGDILVYTGGWGGYGHVAIYESDYSTYHQNWNGHSYVERVTNWKYNSSGSIHYWGVIRPDFKVTASSGTSSVKQVSVTGVSLNKSKLTLAEGKTAQLSATVKPTNATNKKVTWSSSNSGIVKVSSNGNITAVKAGTAVITVKSSDGSKTAKCTVTVPFTGVKKVNGRWVFIRNGKADYTFTGIAKATTGKWVFIKNGYFNTSYTGVAQTYNGYWSFVRNGRFDRTFTGVAKATSGKWVYINNGKYNNKFTGIAKLINSSKKVYVKNGKWIKTYTGKYAGYNIKNGIVV